MRGIVGLVLIVGGLAWAVNLVLGISPTPIGPSPQSPVSPTMAPGGGIPK